MHRGDDAVVLRVGGGRSERGRRKGAVDVLVGPAVPPELAEIELHNTTRRPRQRAQTSHYNSWVLGNRRVLGAGC